MILDAAAIPFSGGWHPTDQSYYFGGHMAVFGGPTNNDQTGNFNVSFQGAYSYSILRAAILTD